MSSRTPLDRSERVAPGAVCEDNRLAALAAYGEIDECQEDAFDRLVRLLCNTFAAPMAVLSFIDRHDQWFKARIGLDMERAPREMAFCDIAITQDEPLLVPDATKDPRFSNNPYVVGEASIRSYAGAPLIVEPGVRIGAIAVLDVVPREFSEAQVQSLVDISRIAVDELRLKRASREAEQARNQLSTAIEALPDGFILYDETDRLVLYNRRFTELFPECTSFLKIGRTFPEIMRQAVEHGAFPDAVGCEESWLEQRIAQHRNPDGAVEQRTASGGWVLVNETKTATGATVGFRVDITRMKKREAELFELATRDALTGLMSRRSMLDELERALARSERYGTPCSVLVLDIDHFKRVNDRCGHQTGDEVLNAFAERVRATVREVDRVGRLGGEEFMVLLADTDMPGAMLTAERLRRAIEGISVAAKTIQGDPADVRITVSIGLTEFQTGETAADVYARADANLYEAKAAGRNCIYSDCDPEVWGATLDIAG